MLKCNYNTKPIVYVGYNVVNELDPNIAIRIERVQFTKEKLHHASLLFSLFFGYSVSNR